MGKTLPQWKKENSEKMDKNMRKMEEEKKKMKGEKEVIYSFDFLMFLLSKYIQIIYNHTHRKNYSMYLG